MHTGDRAAALASEKGRQLAYVLRLVMARTHSYTRRIVTTVQALRYRYG